jgi:RsiW-degrading membrane proteinase PrsW (M82 family)
VIRPWSAVRTPSFWLLLTVTGIATALTLVGAAFLGWIAPWSALASAPLVAGYAALSLLLIRQLDRLGRRPWWLVALALLWGATVSVLVGAGAGASMDNLLGRLFSPEFASLWGAAIVAPPAEELAKVAGVVFLLLAARPYLRSVFAGAVYGAIVGVGFAAVEDFGYALLAADDTLPDAVGEALRTLALRFTVPGAVGHPLFTAVAGAGVAYFVVRTDRTRARRVAVLVGASALAWLTHAAVNSPVAITVTEAVDGLPGFAALTGYLLVVGIPGGASFYWLAALRRGESARLAEQLSAGGPELATDDEAAGLTAIGGRGRAARAVSRAHGRRAGRAARRVQQVQLRLVDLPAESPVAAHPIGYAPPPPAYPVWVPPVQVRPYQSGPPAQVLPVPLVPPPQPVPLPWVGLPPGMPPPQPHWMPPGTPPVPPWAGLPPGMPPPPHWGGPPVGGPPWWPAPGGWGQPSRPMPRQTMTQRRAAELAQARTVLEELTGSSAVPAAVAVPVPASIWLVRSVLGLAVLGLAFWPAALAGALLVVVPLVGSWRRHLPVTRGLQLASIAVAISGYPWLASLLALWLFPGSF